MSDLKLEEIKKRLKDATAGPWQKNGTGTVVCDLTSNNENTVIAPKGDWRIEESEIQADFDLIAHAPEDIRWLIGEVERLSSLYGDKPCPVCGDYFESNDKLEAENKYLQKNYADKQSDCRSLLKERDQLRAEVERQKENNKRAIEMLVHASNQERDAFKAEVESWKSQYEECDKQLDAEIAVLHNMVDECDQLAEKNKRLKEALGKQAEFTDYAQHAFLSFKAFECVDVARDMGVSARKVLETK